MTQSGLLREGVGVFVLKMPPAYVPAWLLSMVLPIWTVRVGVQVEAQPL